MPKIHDYQKELQKTLQKEKLRKAKKARPNTIKKGPRKKDWRYMDNDEYDDLSSEMQDERIMPKGMTENRKENAKIATTVILNKGKDVTDPNENNPNTPDCKQGMVVEVSSGLVKVNVEGEVKNCLIKGLLKKEASEFTNLIVVGDQVMVRFTKDSHIIEKVLPRNTVLSRPDRSNPSLHQLVAANVDLLLIVASWCNPDFWPELIDRYLIAAERFDLQAVLCINKIDLVNHKTSYEVMKKIYRDIGYQVITTSAEKCKGIEELRSHLQNKTSVFAGLSGVGKSSLLSQLDPGLNLRALSVGERGKNRNQGRHTTTMATLYQLPKKISVIDTPGIRNFGIAGLEKSDLSHYYPEMDSIRGSCKYKDCLHLQEESCAVRKAVYQGSISQMRYENYKKIMGSI